MDANFKNVRTVSLRIKYTAYHILGRKHTVRFIWVFKTRIVSNSSPLKHSYNSRLAKGYAVAQCLRHCAINRKIVGWIPDGVTGFYHWHNLFGRTMALASTQPLTEMSTKNISLGKGGRCVGLTTLPHSCADCLKIWEPYSPRTLRTCQGLWWDFFDFTRLVKC
jgi:hypothetical protein